MPTLTPEAFIARWQHADGSELANYQLFVTDLCHLLAVPSPDPAREDKRDNACVFERRITYKRQLTTANTTEKQWLAMFS